MDTIMGMGMLVWALALIAVGFCLFISPLMIWKHTKATSQKLDELIRLAADKTRI
ncbi:MAG: hypothetical protein P9L90_06255 [Candidatus Aadella gelida]|nr:hypothetical protein [Candidatus Aadella gelida]